MMDELRELYQEVILDHGKSPRNFGSLANANHMAHGHNPMCGDTLIVYLHTDADGRIADVSFRGQGCAISMASASMMTELVKGKPIAEAEKLFNTFHEMCTHDEPHIPEDADGDAIERLRVLAGVKDFPVRVKCATLAWHTLEAAAHDKGEISTE